jgi:hypothetical protein
MIPFYVADRPISLSILKGIELPENITIGIMGRATTSLSFQRLFSEYPYGIDVIYKTNHPPDNIIRKQTIKIADSGVFGKVGCQLNYEQLFQIYERMNTQYGIMIDVIKDSFATFESAKEAIRIYQNKQWRFNLIGVAQGNDPDEYIKCYSDLLSIGFEYIAVGGLLKRYRNTARYVKVNNEQLLVQVLYKIRKEFNPSWLFVLGCLHPKRVQLFSELGVWGSDSKGWIFNYEKKDKLLKLIEKGRECGSDSILLQNLSIHELENMTEQEIRFKLVREFIKQKIINKISEVHEKKIINS